MGESNVGRMNRALAGELHDILEKQTGLNTRGLYDPRPLLRIDRLKKAVERRMAYLSVDLARARDLKKGIKTKEGARDLGMRIRDLKARIRKVELARDILMEAEQDLYVRQYADLTDLLQEDVSLLGLTAGNQDNRNRSLEEVMG